jgi:tRNA pseudouridine55 synthase
METMIARPTRSTPSGEPEAGRVLLVHKPQGWTSFDVVHRLRWILGVKKAGHAGTLDPMATGLLVICTGRKTKEIGQFLGLDKEYTVHMILGARTASYDAETAITERRSTEGITEDKVREVVSEFVGPQTQIPPMWSAAKVDGTRLYKLARKGKTVERTPREVYIRSITPLQIDVPDVLLKVECSKGTYIRTLVDDIGIRLGCGAHVAALERTRIGKFRLEDALSIEEVGRRAANPSSDGA